MKAYIVETQKIIEPFGKHPKECLIGDKELISHQIETLKEIGVGMTDIIFVKDVESIEESDECIIMNDSLYFTKELLQEFISRSKDKNNNTICTLRSGVTTLRTVVATQDVKIFEGCVLYDLYYSPSEKHLNDICPSTVIIDPDHQALTWISMPKHICSSGEYLIPVTDTFVVQIDHWTNLWAVNIITQLSRGAKLKKASRINLLLFALKNRSANKWKLMKGLNKIGKSCDIHPTAYIEGSIIGDNAVIEAGAIVKESFIGDNAVIGNGVVIEESVIGKKSTILNGHILYSVIYPSTFSTTHMISTSIIGKNSFIGSGAVLTDFRFDDKNIMVMKNGSLIDTQNRIIGCCLGNGVYLGSGCVVSPGRIIPNNIRIVLDDSRVVKEIDFNKESRGYKLIKDT